MKTNTQIQSALPVLEVENDPRYAALFAAAPELLAALRNLLAEFDRYDSAMAAIGRGHEDYGKQRETARAVILKAEGGAA